MTLDVLGIGFGPANLALAIALEEAAASQRSALTAAYVERQSTFGWHRGMLLPGSTMQVAFLKDLVTLRTPTSPYSFPAYLHEQSRLVEFINHKTLFPTRAEFHRYLEWAADKVAADVQYGTEAVGVEPVFDDSGVVRSVRVLTAGRHPGVLHCRALVLAPGLSPVLPPGVVEGPRIWHTRDLLTRLAGGSGSQLRRVVVVGSGQSAAEAAGYLYQHLPDAVITVVMRRFGYSPSDDSPFANAIFDPDTVDGVHRADPPDRAALLAYHANTNYSVVDADLIDELYRHWYSGRVSGRQRLDLRRASVVRDVTDTGRGVHVRVDDLLSGSTADLDADLVVFGTGYQPTDPREVLPGLAGYLLTDDAGRPQVERDYQVRTTPDWAVPVYLQGGTEHTHGLSSSLLSNIATRAGEIAASASTLLTGRRAGLTLAGDRHD